MKRKHLLSSILLLFAISCAYRSRPELSEKDLAYYVRFLSSDSLHGRLSGTVFAKQAADFLATQYRNYGLSPAFANSYFQDFTFSAGVEPGTRNQFVFSSSGPGISGNLIPLPFARPGKVDGELVFLSYCIYAPDRGRDDFAGFNIAGKIVFCLRYGPEGESSRKFGHAMQFRVKYDQAVKRGAAGVVFFSAEGSDPDLSDFPFQNESGPPAAFIHGDSLKSVSLFSDLLEKMKKKEALESTGRVIGKISFETDFKARSLSGRNVGAFAVPFQAGQRIIVFGAHYDHLGEGDISSLGKKGEIHNGADDNASGSSAVLEIAGEIASRMKEHPDNYPGVNFLFLNFDGEERGLFGSSHFVKDDYFNTLRIDAMINLDMVGRLRPDKGLYVQGYQTGDERLNSIIDEAFRESRFPSDIKMNSVPGGNGPSDHLEFYRKKMPVVFLFTGSHRQYHTQDDDFETINISGALSVAKFAELIGLKLALLDRPIAYRQAPSEPEREAFDFDVRLGIVPAGYENNTGGVEVGGLAPGAPVAAVGIQEGDRVIELGGQKIDNIRDLMAFLGDAKLHVKYKIVFLRKDRRIEAETELMGGH